MSGEQAFEALTDYLSTVKAATLSSAASLYVMQAGEVVLEWYAGTHDSSADSSPVDAESQFNVASVRKTYLGLAISLALHEGRIAGLDDPVTDYLPEGKEDLLRGTTIRHLLTHTHGLEGNHRRLFPPGTDWSYNNAGVNLLIRIVSEVFGEPLAQVMRRRVFEPYGLAETGWRKHEHGKLVWMDEVYAGELGGEANLFVSTRDLARWGQLHLTKGLSDGKQPIPSAVFERAVSIATPQGLDDGLPRNGFFWRVQDRPRAASELGGNLPLGAYQSLGVYGNAVLVIPETETVAVRMLNQTEPNPPGYDYLADIQSFGNLAYSCACGRQSRHLT
jgi:CubicO group peptidase (beta-lactamase class C family)